MHGYRAMRYQNHARQNPQMIARRRIFVHLDSQNNQRGGCAERGQSGYPGATACITGQSNIGNIDRHKQQQEAGTAHGRNGLQRNEVRDEEGKRGGNQCTFKMLVA